MISRTFQAVFVVSFLLLTLPTTVFGQATYKVYAVEYAASLGKGAVKAIAVGSTSADSISTSFYVWLLKGSNGKVVLVDGGFVRDSATASAKPLKYYERPDLALQPLHVEPDAVTDVIITHAHYDHMGTIDRFKKATVWMQKAEYAYLVGDAWQAGADNRGLTREDARKAFEINLEGRLRFLDGDSVEVFPGIRAFTGSRHTFCSQHLLVTTASESVMLASDDAWYYANLEIPAPIPLTFDSDGYLRGLRRMNAQMANKSLIIPGHDALVMQRFPRVAPHVVEIR